MKLHLLIGLLASFSSLAFASSDFDFLAKKNVLIRNAAPVEVFERTADNVKAIFERYQPKLDSGSKIVSPLQVAGTRYQPVVKVSIRKCVGFICQTVDLDTEISIFETAGSCERNFLMQADLRRSSATLTDVYDRLDVAICFKNTVQGEALLELTANAHRARNYSGGIVQRQIMEFLQLQIQPITLALAQTLRANGSTAPLPNK